MSTIAVADADSTFRGVAGPDRPDHGLWIRRTTIAVLVVIQLAAGAGLLGVRSRTATASRDGYQLHVTYPLVARAGLDVPLTIRIRAPHEIGGDVVIGVSADYLRMFESQGFFPEPAEMTADSDTVYLTFSPPPAGRDLVINFDAYIQPANQRGKAAVIEVLTGGQARVALPIRTILLP